MALAVNPFASSTARPLPLARRADLQFRAAGARQRPTWIVKDPVSLRYYELRAEEYFVLRLLDGRTSSDQIQAQFAHEYAPQRLKPEQLQAFVGRLHREGLVVSHAPRQGFELLERRKRLNRLAWLEKVSNVLAIRFRGVDPNRFLGRLEPWCRWMFSAWFAAVCVLLIVAAVGLVVLHFDTLQSRLPDFYSFFSAGNLIWLALAVAVVKVLHELGHAVACRHFGGECHELGLMLLVFTPCLYCNVSDVWMMADKWRRVAVGAAGMAVELVLAATATLLWWWTAPGLLNGLCLDLMFVCSVSTLLFNGNPLLRYDGYFILSDLLETTNLGERANRVVLRWLAHWAWGVTLPPERLLPERGRAKLAIYAIVAAVYRVFVVAAILWFLHRALKPYHLEVLAEAVAVLVIGGLIVAPAVRTVAWIRAQQRNQRMHWGRFCVRMAWVAAAIVVLLIVPLPNRLKAPAVLEPAGAQRIYVTVPGTLIEAAPAGQPVKAGAIVAKLQNAEVELELVQLKARRDREQLHLSNLRRQQGGDATAAAQIPTAEKALAEAESQLAQRNRDQQRLTLTAPQDGTVLPPHQQPSNAAAGELPAWTGTPLDPRNAGAYLETGTLVCLIGDPNRLEATLVIDQADVELVRASQQVRIQLDELPGETLSGTIDEIAELNLKTAPRDLAARGELPVRPDERGAGQPLNTVYEARVSIAAASVPVRSGATGVAKIYADPQSLGRRLIRYLQQTFQLRG